MIPEYWIHEGLLQPSLLKHVFYSLKGDRVQILSPGTWSPLEGPDFQNALVVVNGTRIRGDIEIHRTLQEWFHHGHHLDNRYTNVVLHILFQTPKSIPPALQHIPHLLFPDMLAIPLAEWETRMATASHHRGQHLSLAPLPGTAELWDFSHRRFLRKARRIAEWHHQFTPEDMVFISLAEALGYPSNSRPLAQLMWQYPPSRWSRLPFALTGPDTIVLFLYYLSGFSIPRSLLPIIEPWKSAGVFPLLTPREWHFAGVRPTNRPVVRLAGLATLLAQARQLPNGLFHSLREVIQQRWPFARWRANWERLLRPLIPPGIRQLIHLLAQSTPLPHHALGQARFHQVVINGLLPLFYWWAIRNQSPGFAEYVWDLYEQYPQPLSTRVLHQVWHHWQRVRPGDAQLLQRSGALQQGVYEWLALHSWSLPPRPQRLRKKFDSLPFRA